jgi:hypothetical protein
MSSAGRRGEGNRRVRRDLFDRERADGDLAMVSSFEIRNETGFFRRVELSATLFAIARQHEPPGQARR